ncbi:MAG TPA: GNAT family N-acetyltransferase [Candidatus Limnocylindrales bacterium]|nr:GNAT family N-acetyltransferase [Candidatus Limnocylindrales bacterium]
MSEVPAPRTDTTDLGLIEAIAADQVAARIIAPEIKVEVHLDPDVSWAVAPLADPFRNVVLGSRFTPQTADARIAELVARYREAGTSFVWWVSPYDEPGDLGARLGAAGLVLEGTAPAMAVDLADVPLDERPPSELEVVPVTDAATLDEFLDVIAADWLEWTDGEHTEVQRRTLEAWRTQIPPKLAGEPVPLRWIGRVGGRVVATSRISIGAGVAGLYAVSTLPAHRGHGYGRALTIASLRAARQIDYRIGVLQASDLGYGVYKRLGFRDLFSYGVFVHPGGGAG